jgi:hypothetical protein
MVPMSDFAIKEAVQKPGALLNANQEEKAISIQTGRCSAPE